MQSPDRLASPSIKQEIEDSAAAMASRQGLSPSAAAFTPMSEPHSLMISAGASHLKVSCNLATLTLQELHNKVAMVADQPVGTFQLSFNNSNLPVDSAKALDIGIGNYCSISSKGLATGAPSTPEYRNPQQDLYQQQIQQLQQQIQLQQLQQQHQQLQQQRLQSQLAAQIHAQLAHYQNAAAPPALQAQYIHAALQLNHLRQLQICHEYGLTPSPPPPTGYPSPQNTTPPHATPRSVVRQRAATPMMGSYSAPGTPTPTPPPAGLPTGCINLSAIAGQFATFALTSAGSRALIDALRTTPAATLVEVIPKLIDDMQEFVGLVTHKHGSEVVREVIEVANQEQREQLLEMACVDIVEIAESSFGCEVLLQLVEAVPEGPVIKKVVAAMAENIYQVMISHTARKLVVKVLSKQYSADVMGVFEEAVVGNLLQIAKESKGCVTMKRCIDLASKEFRKVLQDYIVAYADELIPDQYGNYLMQHVIDTQEAAAVVADKICAKMIMYSTNKMGSHVIEKCMQMGSEATVDKLVKKMLEPENLEMIIKDQYGNYIVQNAIEKIHGSMVLTIKEAVAPFLSDSQFGHKIEQKIARRVKWFQSTAEKVPVPADQNRREVPAVQVAAPTPCASVP